LAQAPQPNQLVLLIPTKNFLSISEQQLDTQTSIDTKLQSLQAVFQSLEQNKARLLQELQTTDANMLKVQGAYEALASLKSELESKSTESSAETSGEAVEATYTETESVNN
jgi:hypothetical protein